MRREFHEAEIDSGEAEMSRLPKVKAPALGKSKAGAANPVSQKFVPSSYHLERIAAKKLVPVIRVVKDSAFFRVLIDPPIPEGHPHRRPQTYGSLASAQREAETLTKLTGGAIANSSGDNV